MKSETSQSQMRHGLRLHPLALRIMHWTNALAMIIMIGSGWKIYNDEVLFGWLHFPDEITIGGEAQGALQWHLTSQILHHFVKNHHISLCFNCVCEVSRFFDSKDFQDSPTVQRCCEIFCV